MALNAPLVGSIAKADTFAETAFATYAKCPDGSTVTAEGAEPAAKGDPLTGVKTPVFASILYADTLFDV
jgi:hypothetical protein